MRLNARPLLRGLIRRPQLRTQVLAGVLLVTIVALTAFDLAAVSALRSYLLNRTDSSLHAVLNLYQPGRALVLPRGLHPAHRPTERRVSRFTVVGPRLKVHPPILDQFYLVYVPKAGASKVFLEGNPQLVPRRLGALVPVRAQVPARSVFSAGGNPLRTQSMPLADGTLVAAPASAKSTGPSARSE